VVIGHMIHYKEWLLDIWLIIKTVIIGHMTHYKDNGYGHMTHYKDSGYGCMTHYKDSDFIRQMTNFKGRGYWTYDSL